MAVWKCVANTSAAVSRESLYLSNSIVGQAVLSSCICVHTVNTCVTRTQVTLKPFFFCQYPPPVFEVDYLLIVPEFHVSRLKQSDA